MANHKSEIKRAGQNEIRRLRNKARKTRIKTAGKDVREAVTGGDRETAATNLNLAKSVIDTAVKKRRYPQKYRRPEKIQTFKAC